MYIGNLKLIFYFCFNRKLYHSESQTIDLVLKKIGLVCCNDKMYTLHPSELYYYKNEFTSYSPKRKSFLLKHDVS